MTTSVPRIVVPESVRRGEVFTVKTIISHPMETGLRKDEHGSNIPRKIINKFTRTYAGCACSASTCTRPSRPTLSSSSSLWRQRVASCNSFGKRTAARSPVSRTISWSNSFAPAWRA